MAAGEPGTAAMMSAVSSPRPLWFCQLSPVLVMAVLAGDAVVQRRQAKSSAANGGESGSSGNASNLWHLLQLALACAVYFSSGPGLIVLNKYIMTTLEFPFPVFVSALGSVSLVVVTRLCAALGIWPSGDGDSKKGSHAGSSAAFFRIILPLSLCTNLSMASGSSAYLYLSVPLIQILKSVTLVLVMLLGFVAGTEEFSPRLVLSVATITFGVIVSIGFDVTGGGASTGDSAKFVWGVGLMLLGSSLEAGRATFMQLAVQKMSFFESIYANSVPNCVTALLLSMFSELRGLLAAEVSMSLLAALIVSSLLGVIVVFSTFWITKLVGGLSMKVLVNARNIGLVLFSAIVLGEPCSAEKYIGYSIALVGLGIYNRERGGARRRPGVIAAADHESVRDSSGHSSRKRSPYGRPSAKS